MADPTPPLPPPTALAPSPVPGAGALDKLQSYLPSPGVSALVAVLGLTGSSFLSGRSRTMALGLSALASANYLWAMDKGLKKLQADIDALKDGHLAVAQVVAQQAQK